MILSEQSLREGNLEESLAQLQDQVRKNPAKAEYRVFLFQLLVVLGQWQRALTQLNVLGEMDASTLAMVQTYREALRCEVLRAQVFAGQRSPLIFGQPEEWVALLLEALQLTAQGHYQQAQAVRENAFETAPTTSGSLDGQPFDWIADADTRMGPMLEAIVDGRYYWIPFQRISKITLEKPEDLRDMVWAPVQFTWANGGETVGLIPTRYPGSQDSNDSQILLAHKTEWNEHESDTFLGLGQRVLATDVAEYPLLDTRLIELETAEDAAETPSIAEDSDG
ncbi:MAG: type VI secretion system accessory protein TagJ [Candidatus Competibacteraceae bacterium]|jgi:type VI secretion system protein ImpE|nr:type VI secretion system accessory protein TagJ [Candidatus Competibacteraceae bacterium]